MESVSVSQKNTPFSDTFRVVNPLEQGKCIRFEKIRVVIGNNVSVKNVDFYKTEHDFINDDPFNMPLSQEEKTYPNMTNGNRRTFFSQNPAALPTAGSML
jgi:hypothetical protein